MALGIGVFIFAALVGWVSWKLYDFLRGRQKLIQLIDRIPGPHAIPILGCAYQFKLDSVEFTYQLEDWGRTYALVEDGYGLVRAWVGPIPVVFLCRDEAVKLLLESTTQITKPSQYNFIRRWLGTGLLTSTDEKWHARRKMLTPAFHFNILTKFVPIFSKEAKVFVEQLEKFADSDAEVDLFPFIKRCALDIICGEATVTHVGLAQFRDGDGRGDWRATWTQHGVRGRGGDAEPTHLAPRTSSLDVAEARVVPLGQRLRLRRRARHDHRLHTQGALLDGDGLALEHPFPPSRWAFEYGRLSLIIAERQRNFIRVETQEEALGRRKLAFLDLLLSMQAENRLSDEDIREEVDTFMFEGHDTTSSGMGFAIWFLAQNPVFQAKVHAEVDDVFGDSERLATPEDLKRLPYLEQCIKEALRLMPSVPFFARILTEDFVFHDRVVPKGVTVVVAPVAVHRDPRNYDDPETYNPENFSQENIGRRHPYSFVPFSAGPRNCIGQKFAILEEKAVLSTFFRRYRVTTEQNLVNNRPVPEIIIKPSQGFRVKVYRRTHASH
uniref:Cytochrome P450 n=1 Tax=Steinernema glaseri TaxID=37863 RepID=A0A1I8ARX9_9BILA